MLTNDINVVGGEILGCKFKKIINGALEFRFLPNYKDEEEAYPHIMPYACHG